MSVLPIFPLLITAMFLMLSVKPYPKVGFKITEILCTFILGLHILSCSKNSQGPGDCLAIVKPDTLRFNILNKQNKADLFVSKTPVYDTSEIELFRKEANGNLKKTYHVVEENWEDTHFYTFANSSSDTIFLQIANQPLDTIAFTMTVDQNRPCPKSILEQVTFNSQASEHNAHDRIVLFYKEE